MKSNVLLGLGIGASLLTACSGNKQKAEEKTTQQQKPNVIFLIADDIGYGDLSCYGKKQSTHPMSTNWRHKVSVSPMLIRWLQPVPLRATLCLPDSMPGDETIPVLPPEMQVWLSVRNNRL